jgi:hypothetical protein
MEFEFDVLDALCLELVVNLSCAVDNIGEFVNNKELQILNRLLVTIATTLLPI